MNIDRVVVAGDWHLNTDWACSIIKLTAQVGCDVILQLGDFGIWPAKDGGKEYLDALQAAAEPLGVLIVVVAGNHEDWDQIEAFPTSVDPREFPPAAKWFRENIAVLPRVDSFELNGRKFVSLAGAPSIDYFYRFAGENWWPNEKILPEHIEQVRQLGKADYLLAHDSCYPSSPAVNRIIENPSGWPSYALRYASEGQARMTEALQIVQPRVFLHGHFHVRSTGLIHNEHPEFTTRVESLGTDGNPDNVVMLDVASGEVTDIDRWSQWL